VRLYNDMGFPTEIENCTYIVQAGDNLYRIGLRYGQTVGEIAAANNITNPDMIAAGQELVVPCVEVERAAAPPAANTSNPPDAAPQTDCDVMYAFGSGDTLQQLETLFDTSAGEIASANDFAPGELPGAGQEIFIPCVP
jgi:putative chitinase